MHGLPAANSAIKLILGRVGGDDNEAYADIALGGITEGKLVTTAEGFEKAWVECGEVGSLMRLCTADLLGDVFPFCGDCIWCELEGILPIGDVDGFVEVVDPVDLRGGEQVFREWEECGRSVVDFALWLFIASEKSLDEALWFFWFPLLLELEFILLLIILDSILLQALVSMANGLAFESY